ncbi:MAG: DUF4282 domain-containing protein [Acidimicrobiia bacterium]|nr:DUF4282 domain-containing protein [Acidimicrobiia bacterium]
MTDSGNTPPPPPGDTPPPPPPPGNGGSNSPLGGAADDSTSFISALFDFSFTHFITPKIVRILYILLTIAVGLGYITFVVSAFNASAGFGALALLIIGPIGALIYLAFIRVTLEFYLAVVRMSEDIHKSRGNI